MATRPVYAKAFRERHPDLHVLLVLVPDALWGYTQALAEGMVQVAFGAWQVPPACIRWVLMTYRHLDLLPPGTHAPAEKLDYPDVADMPLVLIEDIEYGACLLAHLGAGGVTSAVRSWRTASRRSW